MTGTAANGDDENDEDNSCCCCWQHHERQDGRASTVSSTILHLILFTYYTHETGTLNHTLPNYYHYKRPKLQTRAFVLNSGVSSPLKLYFYYIFNILIIFN